MASERHREIAPDWPNGLIFGLCRCYVLPSKCWLDASPARIKGIRQGVGLGYLESRFSFMGSEALAAFFFVASGGGTGWVVLVCTFFLLSVMLLTNAKPPSRFLPRLAAGSAAVLGEPALGLLSLASTTTKLKKSPNGFCPTPSEPSA